MPPSLQTVVRRMNLRPVAGTMRPGVLDAAVRWVAVSELADPTPYLEGGELLLTTGMRMEGDLTGYVARLVRRGVAGLGFGVGVSHEEVPSALVEAAESAGLPLLEVPRETPFIAVGKAVSELLAAEQYEEISRAFAAQGRLTRAALRPEGMHAVIDRLAREVGGWAALLDESGEVRHATRGAGTDAVTAELTRLRVDRMPSSLALSGPGEHVVVQPLGGGTRPRGFFAVGAPHAFTPVTHTVINAAGSLLTLAMEQGRAQLAAERRVRTAVLELLLAGEGSGPAPCWERWAGGCPRRRWSRWRWAPRHWRPSKHAPSPHSSARAPAARAPAVLVPAVLVPVVRAPAAPRAPGRPAPAMSSRWWPGAWPRAWRRRWRWARRHPWASASRVTAPPPASATRSTRPHAPWRRRGAGAERDAGARGGTKEARGGAEETGCGRRRPGRAGPVVSSGSPSWPGRACSGCSNPPPPRRSRRRSWPR
ncbi:PucR family transcriptional regulator ligand-binding domain-containing protein [Nonomuraea thailandensis]